MSPPITNHKKLAMNLKGISKTLVMPLYARADFSLQKNTFFHDAQAIKLACQLNGNFSKLYRSMEFAYPPPWVIRSYQFDKIIKRFLQKYPTATIINLGAGLDTTFSRLDNNQLQWIDLDLPEVITLRKQLLPPNRRMTFIAKSILDFSWVEDVKKISEPYFFVAGGLFMYFTKTKVKSIFLTLANQFPKSNLLFDSASKELLKNLNKTVKNDKKMSDIALKWSLGDPNELEKWSSNIKVLSSANYYKGIKTKIAFSQNQNIMGNIIQIKFLTK